MHINQYTLPKTNISPKMVVSNRNLLFQGSIFRGKLLVSGRVYMLDMFCPACHPSVFALGAVPRLTSRWLARRSINFWTPKWTHSHHQDDITSLGIFSRE